MITLTNTLPAFTAHNCPTCPDSCNLTFLAEHLRITADDLRVIGQGVCPFHPEYVPKPRVRHEVTLVNADSPEVRDGIVLVQRIVRLLSA